MKETIIYSFNDYIEHTEKYKNKFLFRGQSNIKWDIVPSIFRNDKSLKNEILDLRDKLKNSKNDILSTLFEMQHYGLPTRLLDLTISPLSALFFCVDSETQSGNDGVIYVIDSSQQYSIDSSDLNRFAESLIKFDEDLDDEDLVSLMCKEYLIKYDYNISYTNKRSILQGGTALIFGFDIVNNNLVRKSFRNIDNIIYEKIIIPSKLKNQIMEELRRIGYDKDILYGTSDFEASETLKYKNIDFELTQTPKFNKIIAKYRLNELRFNKDQLLDIIEDIYENLFTRYGYNARIYLFFLYDDNDVNIGNWVCWTQWDSDIKYKIRWNKDYYSKRLSNMNEQISRSELVLKFKPKIEYARCIHEKAMYIVEVSSYDINELTTFFCDVKDKIRKIVIEVSDIGIGDVEIEKYSIAAENYICDVDLLVSENLEYTKRGENERFIKYWVETKLNDCNKSYSIFIDKLKELNIQQQEESVLNIN